MRKIYANRNRIDGKLETIKFNIRNGIINDIQVFKAIDSSLPVIMPGFVDIHVHGGGGSDTMDASIDAYEKICETHAHHGTTSLLLTTVSAPEDSINNVIRQVEKFIIQQEKNCKGSRVIGLHLEGPFINPERHGAHDLRYLQNPNVKLASQWFSSQIIKMITLAPELEGAKTLIKEASLRGIVVSAGHTTATREEIEGSIYHGVEHLTHLCNAMPPFLHRKPGPVGAVIENEKLTADIICDGVHLDPSMVKALTRGIELDRLCLITDGIRAVDMKDGIYLLGGLEVRLNNGKCTLPDGTIAGSTLTMEQAFRNCILFSGVPPFFAQQMSSDNPARRLGLTRKGKVEQGYDADLVLMKADGSVLRTWVGGQLVYDAI